MTLFEVGRVCVKIAGRDGGRKCVVVEQIDSHSVLVDGDVRRRKVNINHLEPLAELLEVRQGASHEQIKKVFEEKGWKVWEHTGKNVAAKPKHMKKKKAAVKKEASKKTVKVEKKETAKPAEKETIEAMTG